MQDDIRYSDWENASRAIRGEKVVHFNPFHAEIECSGCQNKILMMISPIHLKATVNCPRCGKSLTASIHRRINARAAREKENAEIFGE